MKILWKKTWLKATTWLVAEILLSLIGLDNLADYSEYLFEKTMKLDNGHPKMTAIAPAGYPDAVVPLNFEVSS